MSTLLLRLAAPLQSWGADSKFEERRATMREPTKSGVIGMIAAALGRRRDEPIDDLSGLKFGVRIDQPGKLLRDYNTAKSSDGKTSYVTNRYYLSDAVFLVGLEGDDELLSALDAAICSPVFPLYLGRRSCPPVGKVSLGVSGKGLMEALRETRLQIESKQQDRRQSSDENQNTTYVIDTEDVRNPRRRDLPQSFSQRQRKHSYRHFEESMEPVTRNNALETEHDAFAAVEEGL